MTDYIDLEQFGVGQPIRRVEDARFLIGAGRYLDDIELPGQAHAVIVRSPHAHARIEHIDAEAAAHMPGVIAVFTGADWEADGLGGVPTRTPVKQADGSPAYKPHRPGLAVGCVRFVGDAVALVVAASRQAAEDAAEAVHVDYEPLPAYASAEQALADDARPIWPEMPDNVLTEFEAGDAAAVDAAFARAAHVVETQVDNQRVTAVSLEPRGAIGRYDADADRYELICSTQNVHANRGNLASGVFDVEPDRIRQWAPDVGGGFGAKNSLYPEHALALWAARRVGRPVKWVSSRGEAFASDCHGRDQQSRVQLALDANGRFLALRVESTGSIGAYLLSMGGFTCTGGTARTQGGPYRLPACHFRARAVLTNTSPVEPYRGAGRPEASLQMEQVVDAAARELGLTPAEIRRRNVIDREELPYTTAMGQGIESGNFALVLEQALAAVDADGHEARAREARRRGHLLGLGIGLYFECTGGAPKEHAAIALRADGSAEVAVGSHSTGMSHETVFAQLVSTRFGLPLSAVRFVQADTAATPIGGGHGGSRSLEMAGGAIVEASAALVERLLPLAEAHLETAVADIEFERARFRVRGTDRAVEAMTLVAESGEAEIGAFAEHERAGTTYPNGCHVAEVEVDIDTGQVRVTRFVVVDDFGRIVNPLTTTGQVMGGVAQGIGQALLERVAYAADSGQLLSGSLMDYALPRADDLCDFEVAFDESAPTPRNPLGAKGCGEAGCCGALPATVNAVANALHRVGAQAPMPPFTAESLWRALRSVRSELS